MTDHSKYETMAQEIRQQTEHAETQCAEEIIARALERAALEELKHAIRLAESADHKASSKADAYKLGLSLLLTRLELTEGTDANRPKVERRIADRQAELNALKEGKI